MNILVTGGCGFIGSATIAALAKSGDHGLRVVDNLTTGTRAALSNILPVEGIDDGSRFPIRGRVQLAEADIGDAAAAIEFTRGIDAVIHLAANTGVPASIADPRTDCETNVVGTLNYLEAARSNGVKRFVFASSSAPLGACQPPIHEGLPPAPMSPYGASKLAGEGYCSSYFHAFGIETVALRFGNVYGPGSAKKTSVVAKFILRAMAGEPLELYGDGSHTRDFIYIDDIVSALVGALQRPRIGGHIFQIATGQEITVGEIAARLVQLLEAAGIRGIELKEAAERAGDTRRSYADARKAERMLGWRAQVDIDEGLRRTVYWFLSSEQPCGTAMLVGAL